MPSSGRLRRAAAGLHYPKVYFAIPSATRSPGARRSRLWDLTNRLPHGARTVTVTTCGRICFNTKKINLSQVFAGQKVGIKQVDERIWLATFMHYDLGYIDDETCRLEPLLSPFGPKVLPMSPE